MSTRRNVLLLDALGTLVRLEPPVLHLRHQLARRFGLELSESEAATALAAEIRYYRAHLDAGADRESLAALRHRCAEVLRGALPQPQALDRVGTEALMQALLDSLRFSAFDDARGALEDARGRQQKLVVASNWDVSLHEVLARLNLANLVDGIVTSAEVGARKPAPAVFERALALAGADPEDALHVGDSVAEDVVGAQRAGIEPVLLSRDGRAAPQGVRTIATLAELAQVAT
ncbi:MAG: HAD-IA family hydrolase [Solirubrobacterales bacterium]|nr:HAD-IA family hydrolase [Solirubrobacterales bacterium]